MFVSNSLTKESTWLWLTTFRTPSLRQSPVGKFRLFWTQISMWVPTPRSVNVVNWY